MFSCPLFNGKVRQTLFGVKFLAAYAEVNPNQMSALGRAVVVRGGNEWRFSCTPERELRLKNPLTELSRLPLRPPDWRIIYSCDWLSIQSNFLISSQQCSTIRSLEENSSKTDLVAEDTTSWVAFGLECFFWRSWNRKILLASACFERT